MHYPGPVIDFAAQVVVSAALLVVAGLVVRGVEISGALPALLGALALTFANGVLSPQIHVATPWPWVTLAIGLGALLVINALLLKVVAAVVPGFRIRRFTPALWAALLLAGLHLLIERVLGPLP